jgi:hypothetical protein
MCCEGIGSKSFTGNLRRGSGWPVLLRNQCLGCDLRYQHNGGDGQQRD